MYTHTSICRIYQIYNTDSKNQLQIYPNLWYNIAHGSSNAFIEPPPFVTKSEVVSPDSGEKTQRMTL